jgi:beta-glucosidase
VGASRSHALLNRWYRIRSWVAATPRTTAIGWDLGEVHAADLATTAAPIDFLGVDYNSRQVDGYPLDPDDDTEKAASSHGHGHGMGGLSGRALEDPGMDVAGIPNRADLRDRERRRNPIDPGDPASDLERVRFPYEHLNAALDALERGVPLQGYFVWLLLDNFERAHGYDPRFRTVDYETQARIPATALAVGPQWPGPGGSTQKTSTYAPASEEAAGTRPRERSTHGTRFSARTAVGRPAGRFGRNDVEIQPEPHHQP